MLSAASTEAVNGSQLFATNANITSDTTAITNLRTDVADLQAQDILLANHIRRTDRRASGGTAVAIAIGGAMFLPDKTFNLTGNVGLLSQPGLGGGSTWVRWSARARRSTPASAPASTTTEGSAPAPACVRLVVMSRSASPRAGRATGPISQKGKGGVSAPPFIR